MTVSPPNLPSWLHVVSDTIPAVVKTLDFWINTQKSTARFLAVQETISPMDRAELSGFMLPFLPQSHSDFRRKVDENLAADREALKEVFLNLPAEELVKHKLLPKGVNPDDARAILEENIDKFLDWCLKEAPPGKIPRLEEK